jgi:hypothetical protein
LLRYSAGHHAPVPDRKGYIEHFGRSIWGWDVNHIYLLLLDSQQQSLDLQVKAAHGREEDQLNRYVARHPCGASFRLRCAQSYHRTCRPWINLLRCRELQRLTAEVERLSIKHPYHNALPIQQSGSASTGAVQAPRPKGSGPSVSVENDRLREEVAKLKDELNRLKLRAVPKPLVVVPPPPPPARRREKERDREKEKLEASVESSTASAPRRRRSASADDSMLGSELAEEARAQLEEAQHALAAAEAKQAQLVAQVDELRRDAAAARMQLRLQAVSEPPPAPVEQPQPQPQALAALTERVALNLRVEDLEERLAVLTDAHRSLHAKHQEGLRELQLQRALVQDGTVQQATTAETIQQLKESKRALLQRVQELQQSLAESSASAGAGDRAATASAALQQQLRRHEETIRSQEATIEHLEEGVSALRSEIQQKAAHIDRLSTNASEVEFRFSEEHAELHAEVASQAL